MVVDRRLRGSPSLPKHHQSSVDADPNQPGRERGVPVEGLNIDKRFEAAVLNGILGVLYVPGNPLDDPGEGLLVTPKEFGEGLMAARLSQRNQSLLADRGQSLRESRLFGFACAQDNATLVNLTPLPTRARIVCSGWDHHFKCRLRWLGGNWLSNSEDAAYERRTSSQGLRETTPFFLVRSMARQADPSTIRKDKSSVSQRCR